MSLRYHERPPRRKFEYLWALPLYSFYVSFTVFSFVKDGVDEAVREKEATEEAQLV